MKNWLSTWDKERCLATMKIQTIIFQSRGDLLSLSTINSIADYYCGGFSNDSEFDIVFEGLGYRMNF